MKITFAKKFRKEIGEPMSTPINFERPKEDLGIKWSEIPEGTFFCAIVTLHDTHNTVLKGLFLKRQDFLISFSSPLVLHLRDEEVTVKSYREAEKITVSM